MLKIALYIKVNAQGICLFTKLIPHFSTLIRATKEVQIKNVHNKDILYTSLKQNKNTALKQLRPELKYTYKNIKTINTWGRKEGSLMKCQTKETSLHLLV